MVMSLSSLLLVLVSFAFSSIPLYLALHIVGSRNAGFLKTVFVNIIAGLVTSAILSSFGLFAGLLAFIAVLFIYREMFDIGWIAAFLAWILQFAIVAILIAALGLILGITPIL